MAITHFLRTTDHLKSSNRRLKLFLDSKPEVTDPATKHSFRLALKARKRTATLLYSTGEFLTVLEFFAVGDPYTAVLLRAVKGGVNLPLTKISAIFKVHLSLFLLTQFFITHLTLAKVKLA